MLIHCYRQTVPTSFIVMVGLLYSHILLCHSCTMRGVFAMIVSTLTRANSINSRILINQNQLAQRIIQKEALITFMQQPDTQLMQFRVEKSSIMATSTISQGLLDQATAYIIIELMVSGSNWGGYLPIYSQNDPISAAIYLEALMIYFTFPMGVSALETSTNLWMVPSKTLCLGSILSVQDQLLWSSLQDSNYPFVGINSADIWKQLIGLVCKCLIFSLSFSICPLNFSNSTSLNTAFRLNLLKRLAIIQLNRFQYLNKSP